MQFARWMEAVARGVTEDLLKRAPARAARRQIRNNAISAERLEQRIVMSGSAPMVTAIARTTGTQVITSAPSVGFNVTFNQSVTGVAAADFKVITDGSAAFTSPVSVTGSGSAYQVTVNGVHGNGDLQLELVDNDTIVNSTSVPLGGAGIGNGSFIGQSYSILQVFPTVQSINRTSPAGPTAPDGSVTYTVTFSAAVTGVGPTAFAVVTTGSVAASSPVVVSGSGTTYSVTVNGITGTGTLGLNLVDNSAIHDLNGNPLQGSPPTAGTFQQPLAIGNFAAATTIAAADVNGDGFPDLIASVPISPYGNVIAVMLGNGNGTFQASKTSALGSLGAYAIVVADMNGDGIPDLVVANENAYPGSVGILLGNGNGTFGAEATFATKLSPHSIAVADLNGDGRMDVVAANSQSNSLSVLLGNGNGTLQGQTTFAVGNGPRSVTIADVNGDGNPDLIVANYDTTGVGVLLGNGDGTFHSQQVFNAGSGPYSVTAADVNGDGSPDLIVANKVYHQIHVLLNNGSGTFQSPITINSSSFPDTVTVSDLNGDGNPDLIVSNPSSMSYNHAGSVGVFLGNGNGTFASQQYSAGGSTPTIAAVADFNGDGRPDVVFNGGLSNLSTTASLLLNSGVDNFTGQTYVISTSVVVSDTINGTSGNDSITLIQDASSPYIDWTMGSSSGTLPINDPNGLTIHGNGGNDTITLDYTNGNPLPNTMHLDSGTGNFTINNLQGTAPLAGTTVDIERSTLFINYGANPDPLALIQTYLQIGYNGGAWNGTSTEGVIISAAAQANHAAGTNTTGIGYADSADGQGINTVANTIELTYTLYGDANLDHVVNAADLQRFLNFFNTAGPWDNGDFNYDRLNNSADQQIILFNFNTQLGSQAAPAASTASSASSSPPPAPPATPVVTVQSPPPTNPVTATTHTTAPKVTAKTLAHSLKPPKPQVKSRHHHHN